MSVYVSFFRNTLRRRSINQIFQLILDTRKTLVLKLTRKIAISKFPLCIYIQSVLSQHFHIYNFGKVPIIDDIGLSLLIRNKSPLNNANATVSWSRMPIAQKELSDKIIRLVG